jgi:hypothetical protein
MNQHIDPAIELKIQKEIRQAEDKLVIWIQEVLDKESTYGKLEESQFRNLVRVSNTTESPEVIKNFLRYQVGRDQKWGRGKGSLAEGIILHIGQKSKEEELKGKILSLAETIAGNSDPKELDRIWIELIRRYLGYGARYLKYLNDGRKI